MSTTRRAPQQGRGERRVAALLEAAAAVMTEVGYEAATMTAIAERAVGSIGTLYQYFPNKEELVQALRQQYVEEIEVRWRPLVEEAAGLSVEELVDRLVETILEQMERRPAFLPTLGGPGAPKRNRLRERLAVIFRERRTEMGEDEARRVANVTVQVLKSLHPIYVEASGGERGELVREYKAVLMGYLGGRLRGEGIGSRE